MLLSIILQILLREQIIFLLSLYSIPTFILESEDQSLFFML